MVLSTFNPLYNAAAAMYQQRDERATIQQPSDAYYQRQTADYGNRIHTALPYQTLFPSSNQDPFYSATEANLLAPTPAYGTYGHQPQPLSTSPFTPSPTSFKCESSFQQQSIISDTVRSEIEAPDELRNVSTTSRIKNCSPISCLVQPYSTSAGQQQPSVTLQSSYPCRPYPIGGENKFETDHRTSPSNYFYATGASASVQSSYYTITPPTTGFFLSGANANPSHQAANFGSNQFGGENVQSNPLAQEYPWMRSRYPVAAANGPITNGSNAAMEIGWYNNTNQSRTRTREKYRMVYTDGQRFELEKEFITSEYISTQRKSYLSRTLGLSERQIKIWFQNRRAKKRKQTRRTGASSTSEGNSSNILNQSQSRATVSSTSDFRALPSVTTSEEGVSRQHSLEDISGSPDLFL